MRNTVFSEWAYDGDVIFRKGEFAVASLTAFSGNVSPRFYRCTIPHASMLPRETSPRFHPAPFTDRNRTAIDRFRLSYRRRGWSARCSRVISGWHPVGAALITARLVRPIDRRRIECRRQSLRQSY